MKQPYFCSNCKQFHASCKQNMSKSNSVQYLRFSDLFNQVPNAHPQNFNLNSPRHPEDSKLVYENEQARRIRLNRHHTVAKISSTQTFTPRGDRYNPNQNRSNSTLKSKQKPKYEQSTARKTNGLSSTSVTRLKTQQRSISNLEEFKQKTRNIRKQVTVHMDFTDKRNAQGPYYVVTKLNPNSNNERQSGIYKKPEFTTQLKRTFTFKDKDKQSLAPTSKIEQFKFGDLTESKQEIIGDNLSSNAQSKINKKQYQYQYSYPGAKDQTIYENKLQNSQSDMKELDYANKLSELKQILKSNEKNYKQKTNRIIKEPQQFTRHLNRPLKSGRNIENIENINKQNFLIPKIKDKGQLRAFNEMKEHQYKENINKTCCQEPQKCKYFDNRCLGVSLCDEGQVNFITGTNNLL